MAWNEGRETCPTERALCAAVCAEPYDDTPRLVYADWLEENHQIEKTCPKCANVWFLMPCPECGGDKRVQDKSRALRTELIRLQCAMPLMPETVEVVEEMSTGKLDELVATNPKGLTVVPVSDATDNMDAVFRVQYDAPNPDIKAAADRVAEIVRTAREGGWFNLPGAHPLYKWDASPVAAGNEFDMTTNVSDSSSWYHRVRLTVDRGFVGTLHCRTEWFMANHASVMWSHQPSTGIEFSADCPVTAQPVTAVYFTDKREAEVREMWPGLHAMWPWCRFGWFNTYASGHPTGGVEPHGLIEPPARSLKPGDWFGRVPETGRRRRTKGGK